MAFDLNQRGGRIFGPGGHVGSMSITLNTPWHLGLTNGPMAARSLSGQDNA